MSTSIKSIHIADLDESWELFDRLMYMYDDIKRLLSSVQEWPGFRRKQIKYINRFMINYYYQFLMCQIYAFVAHKSPTFINISMRMLKNLYDYLRQDPNIACGNSIYVNNISMNRYICLYVYKKFGFTLDTTVPLVADDFEQTMLDRLIIYDMIRYNGKLKHIYEITVCISDKEQIYRDYNYLDLCCNLYPHFRPIHTNKLFTAEIEWLYYGIIEQPTNWRHWVNYQFHEQQQEQRDEYNEQLEYMNERLKYCKKNTYIRLNNISLALPAFTLYK